MSDREVHQLLGHKILLIFKPEYQQDQKKKKTPKKKKKTPTKTKRKKKPTKSPTE